MLRRGWDGIEGVDTGEALRRLGDVPQDLALELLEAAEAGMLAGIAERRERAADQLPSE